MKYLEDYKPPDFKDSFLEKPPTSQPKTQQKGTTMNPEQLLEEVATAIKHRTISTSFRWYLIYYYNRVTCVPSYVPVPPEIILSEFTEQQVQRGFTAGEWTKLKIRVMEFVKELNK